MLTRQRRVLCSSKRPGSASARCQSAMFLQFSSSSSTAPATRTGTGFSLPLSDNTRLSKSDYSTPVLSKVASLINSSPAPASDASRAATFTLSPSAVKSEARPFAPLIEPTHALPV